MGSYKRVGPALGILGVHPRFAEVSMLLHGRPREIYLDVSRREVWKALTDAVELQRWFALTARVVPGSTGRMDLIWPGGAGTRLRILAWTRHSHLRLQQVGEALDGPILDFQLRSTGTTTRMRVARESGPGPWPTTGPLSARDGEWEFTLIGFRHYLHHHRGADRSVVVASRCVPGNVRYAWAAMTGPGGLFGPRGLLDFIPGRRFRMGLGSEEALLRGRQMACQPPWRLLGVLESPAQGLVTCQLSYVSEDESRLSLTASGWRLDQAGTAGLEAVVQGIVEGWHGRQSASLVLGADLSGNSTDDGDEVMPDSAAEA
ncbi:MAG TPA: SRPBCC domain-containing protein [Gemmatimonadales bacterium]|nr:SRPBCC domain-containing protein [Gemmatimonadales bacterium]